MVFRTSADVMEPMRAACREFHELGESEEGRPLYGVVLGRGPRTVSLIAGCHADEPVGPETLRTLALEPGRIGDLLDRWRFVIVPHVNPDGEARNRAWIDRWPDPAAYLAHAVREPPGRDIEFGFPGMRVENRLVAEFLRAHAPYALHMSMHGMAIAEGAMLLIERHWIDRTHAVRAGFTAAVEAAGLGLHDHDRKGEKGFHYIGPGFTTTPEGVAMRRHFRARRDEATARLFHESSMEFVRGLGGDPLSLVTELPLFVVPNNDPLPGVPTAYLELRKRLPDLRLRQARGEPLGDLGLEALPLRTALSLQFDALRLGLTAVA